MPKFLATVLIEAKDLENAKKMVRKNFPSFAIAKLD